MPVTKFCESCGKPVTRSPAHMKGIIYCSRECANRKKNFDIPRVKTCENCGRRISKVPKETWSYWKSKKFCNHECYSKSLKGKKNPKGSEILKELWKNDDSFKKKMMNRPAYSEETRKKIGKASKGRKLTENQKKKISERMKGEKHPFYGKKMNQESVRKMSESKKGKPLSEEHKQKLSKLMTGREISESTRKKTFKNFER
jgi:hypothetical protein